VWKCFVILVALAQVASAAPVAPCARCTLDAPAKRDGMLPLVVVLHGDRESASHAASRWRAAVIARGWALLALQCPTDRGCKDSFWQWDGEPSWVLDQIARAGKTIAIDPARIYLVGWSGGATYMGRHAQAWQDAIAALVIHGGGHEPYDEACPSRALPAYFLVGDKNPLHALMKDLRAYYDRCKQEAVWDLVRGADHDGEDRALDTKKTRAILDWLAKHQR
jgi:polyhydroxybutyrate depolymerase